MRNPTIAAMGVKAKIVCANSRALDLEVGVDEDIGPPNVCDVKYIVNLHLRFWRSSRPQQPDTWLLKPFALKRLLSSWKPFGLGRSSIPSLLNRLKPFAHRLMRLADDDEGLRI